MLDRRFDDAALLGDVAAARDGNERAFTRLTAALQPRVYRWALAFAHDADEADDITQDVFIALYRSLRKYRGDAPLHAWLYRITRRAAESRRRTAARRERLRMTYSERGNPVYHTDPGGRVDRANVAALVREFFATLPPRQREIFDLVDLQGYDPSDVATMIEMNPSTVRAHLFRARSAVRARLLAEHPATVAER